MSEMAKKYCVLDIETSGFDPLTCEVLEVGFAFFDIEAGPDAKGANAKRKTWGLRITEEWTQVFHPAKPVSAQILGLTGISQKELDEAPKFAEHRDFLQTKLGDAVIVGHNIAFDTKFLEGFGLKFSGQTIDTLDLVQWLLPTYHSYNLENLMHYFGISHKEAHRALADSKATLKLLERLLQLYNSFPAGLREQIVELITPQKFIWQDLLAAKLPALPAPPPSWEGATGAEPGGGKFKLAGGQIYNFPLRTDYESVIAARLKANKTKALLVPAKTRQVLELYRRKLVDCPIFSPEISFDEKKFRALLGRENFSADEMKFVLKVLVWQKTNWQTLTFCDLNLSFFGGQFRELISGGKIEEIKSAGLAACDQRVFASLAGAGLYRDRLAVVCGLQDFENAISAGIGSKISWGYLNYLLKTFYNPELGSGDIKYKEAVQQGLAASDLFFGLTSALLQTDPPSFQYFRVTAETENDHRYRQIQAAAENFLDKLAKLAASLGSDQVAEFIYDLRQFFASQDNRVKWLELSENRCAFLSMPLDIRPLVKDVAGKFKAVSFADSLGLDILPKFFMARLGLQDYRVIQTDVVAEKGQGDLFGGLKQVFGGKPRQIKYHCLDSPAASADLLDLAGQKKNLPAAVLFGSQAAVKEFYEQNYQTLKTVASLLVQHNSGGSNKIFRNFSINQNGLLLATDKFILKHLAAANAVEPVSGLKVKTLILCHLPFEQFTHPYQEALGKTLPNAFMDYALPKALFNFQEIISFFLSAELRDVYIIDAKLSKPYAQVFKDFVSAVPGAVLK